MVILWYYNGIIIGGRALSRGIFNKGKNMENHEEKLFFSQKFGDIRYFVYFCTCEILNKKANALGDFHSCILKTKTYIYFLMINNKQSRMYQCIVGFYVLQYARYKRVKRVISKSHGFRSLP